MNAFRSVLAIAALGFLAGCGPEGPNCTCPDRDPRPTLSDGVYRRIGSGPINPNYPRTSTSATNVRMQVYGSQVAITYSLGATEVTERYKAVGWH